MRSILISILVLMLFASAQLYSQSIILIPDPSLTVSPENCMTLGIGNTLSFERDPSCGPDVIISNDLGATALFTSSDLTFSFTFEEPGDYIIFCNSSPGSVAVPAICISVPEIIPTMGQWSVIILFLVLTILMTQAARFLKPSVYS